MRHIKLFEKFINRGEEILISSILSLMGYYDYNSWWSDEKKNEQEHKKVMMKKAVQDAVSKMKPIPHTKAVYEGAPEVVYHASNTNIDKFKAPAFFSTTAGSYDGDFTYACVLDIRNPLDLRSASYNDAAEWLKLVRDIFKDADNLESIMEFAEKYSDRYGFFKLVAGKNFFDPYRWDIVFDYLKANKYDGAIYRESDESISNFFDGYIVMTSEQIQILYVKEKEKENETH